MSELEQVDPTPQVQAVEATPTPDVEQSPAPAASRNPEPAREITPEMIHLYQEGSDDDQDEDDLSQEEEPNARQKARAQELLQRADALAVAVDAENAPEHLTNGYIQDALVVFAGNRHKDTYDKLWGDKTSEYLQELQDGLNAAGEAAFDDMMAAFGGLEIGLNVDRAKLQELFAEAMKTTDFVFPDDLDVTDINQLKALVIKALPLEAVIPYMIANEESDEDESTGEGSEESEDGVSPSSSERGNLDAGLEKESQGSKKDAAKSWAKKELYYQVFQNKENNMEAFLEAFFSVRNRELTGYRNMEQGDAAKEREGKQLGAETMKESIADGTMPEVSASLIKAVLSEVKSVSSETTINGKKVGEAIDLSDSELLALVKDGGKSDLERIFANPALREKVFGGLTDWVKGINKSGKVESKSLLGQEKKNQLITNLPKTGAHGVTQEALGYLLTRIS